MSQIKCNSKLLKMHILASHDKVQRDIALSLASAARGSNLRGVTTARILEQMIAGYEKSLGYDFEGEKNRTYRPKRIQSLLEQSIRRRWRHLALERLDSVEPVLPLGKTFWALTNEERDAIVQLIEQEEMRSMITSLQGRDAGDGVKMIDAAYWIKGCSSLGRLRYAVMLRVGEGKGSSICLVDINLNQAVGVGFATDFCVSSTEG